MAIKPICDKCGREMTEFGGILLSPPNEVSDVHKYHLCVACYEEISKSMGTSGTHSDESNTPRLESIDKY